MEVPGSLVYRALVTRTVVAACRAAIAHTPPIGFDEYVNELVTAVGEAFNNIVFHGYPEEQDGDPICVIIEPTDGGVAVELRDFGTAFDPTAVDLPERLEPRESGMGIFILRAFVDKVIYSPGKPNSLKLHKQYLEQAAVHPSS